MAIKILIDPPKNVRPEGAIRADVAWKLFLPEFMGDLPDLGKGRLEQFRHWLWWELSRKLGFLHKHPVDPVYILTPDLTEAGKEFMVRTCSLWSDEVFSISDTGGKFDLDNTGGNLWTPPVVNINVVPEKNSAIGKMHEATEGGVHTFYSHVLGATRSYVRAYTIQKGNTYARFHSHTAREELYLVLKGKGTARIAGHTVNLVEGDLISKPTGPDIPSQLLADKGEDLRILDIEIWPEDERKSKDLVHYPDHAELDLFGEGWNLMIPSDSIMGFQDSMENYDKGYRRKNDGTWEPADIPGFRKRVT